MPDVELVKPCSSCLPQYRAALERGWSPDNIRPTATAARHLERIRADAIAFLASLDDIAGAGDPIELPNRTFVPRLPGFTRWIWDGAFCGAISLRWQRDTSALPAHVLGHIGYSVVPWKRGAGYAKQALALMLPEARKQDLEYVMLTTTPDNIASQRVILGVGGKFVERFREPAAYGNAEALLFKIDLAPHDT